MYTTILLIFFLKKSFLGLFPVSSDPITKKQVPQYTLKPQNVPKFLRNKCFQVIKSCVNGYHYYSVTAKNLAIFFVAE